MKRRPILYQPPCFMGFYESKCKKNYCPTAQKPLILLGFSKSSVSPLAPEQKQHPVGCCFCFLSYLSEIFDKYLSLSGTVKSV